MDVSQEDARIVEFLRKMYGKCGRNYDEQPDGIKTSMIWDTKRRIELIQGTNPDIKDLDVLLEIVEKIYYPD